MAVLSVPLNYYLTYPIYTQFMPIDAILSLYQAIRPSVNGLLDALVTFNMPFTFFKGLLDVFLCFLIYKPLSPCCTDNPHRRMAGVAGACHFFSERSCFH